MSSDFERRLRDALHSAAQEVQPAPETWERVSTGIRRRRAWQWLSVGLASVAAVVVALAVVPALLAGGRIGLDPGPAAPPVAPVAPVAPAETATAAPPAGVVTTDGASITVQLGSAGTDELEVPGASLSSLAVWPRSTARAFQVVAVDEAACRLHVYASGSEEVRAVDARVCGPVAFSPDGRHLAWIEAGADGPVLHTIGWDAQGPRPQDDATVGVDTDLADLRLQDWVWTSVSGEEAVGHLVIGGTGGHRQAHRLPIERQGDGALALPRDAALEPISAGSSAGEGDWVVVAEADGGSARYQLRVAPDGQDASGNLGPGLQLVRIADGTEVVAPVRADLPRWGTGSSATLWLAAAGDHVFYGDGDTAFSGLYTEERWGAEALRAVRDADFLPRRQPRPSR